MNSKDSLTPNSTLDAAGLRKQAEELARRKEAEQTLDLEDLSPEEVRHVLYELRVHQIELEMQNAALRKAQVELDTQRERYFDLYDLAPVGYCTISESGLILQTNLMVATLLGVTRAALVDKPFSKFIHRDDQDSYFLLRKEILAGAAKTSELRLIKKDKTLFWAQLQGVAVQDDKGELMCRVVISDISERKHVTELLAKGRKQLANIIEGANVGTWEWNVQTGETVFNERWAQIIGYSLEELAPISIDTWVSIAHPEDLKRSRELLERHFSGELDIYTFECRIKHKDGRWVWVIDQGKVVTWTDGGKPLLMFGTHQDITERKQAEEELLKRWRVMERTPASIVITGRDGTIEYVNPFFSRLTGYSAEEALGQNPRILSSGLHDKAFFRGMWETITSGSIWSGVICNRKKDGTTYWESATISPVINLSGQITHYIAVKEDITERQQAHRDLKIVISSISAILVGVDNHGRVLRWNEAAFRTLRISETQSLGLELTALALTWEWDLVLKGIAKCRGERQSVNINNLQYERADGKEGTLSLDMSPMLDEQGELEGVLILGTDITDFRVLEAQLAQAQKLESIGRLAAGIAHEINTPVQYVGDTVTFLQDATADLTRVLDMVAELNGPALHGEACTEEALARVRAALEEADYTFLKEEMPQSFARALVGVERVATIVKAMRSFSHPGEIEKKAVDINQAIESTIIVSRNEWKYVAAMETDLDPNLPRVVCLPAEMNQVLLNLVVNASHAVGDVVRSTQTLGVLRVATALEDNHVRISITDSGTGIPEAFRNKIFDPFFTTKEVGKGTGQGLAMAYDIVVNKHGGTISFDTEEGRGTTFHIRLPLSDEATA